MTQDRVQDLEGRQGEFPALVKCLLRQPGFNASPKAPPALPSAAAARPQTERSPEPRRVRQPWGRTGTGSGGKQAHRSPPAPLSEGCPRGEGSHGWIGRELLGSGGSIPAGAELGRSQRPQPLRGPPFRAVHPVPPHGSPGSAFCGSLLILLYFFFS